MQGLLTKRQQLVDISQFLQSSGSMQPPPPLQIDLYSLSFSDDSSFIFMPKQVKVIHLWLCQ